MIPSDPLSAPAVDASGMIPALLLQAAAALPGIAIAVQTDAGGWRLWVDTLSGIASIVIALALIVLAIALIAGVLSIRRIYGRIEEMLKRLPADVRPIIGHATDVAENVNYVSTAIRTDVQRLQQTVASANQRLDRAAALAEERIHDFNALLKVMQETAEDLFIGTASTVRGVQVGTETLRRFRSDEDQEDDRDEEDEADELDISVERIAPRRNHP